MLQTIPRTSVNVRVATMSDLPFIDALQKAHSKQLGFFPRGQMEEYIAGGWVLIAEEKFGVGRLAFGVEAASPQFGVGRLASEVEAGESALQTPNTKLQTTQPLGYVASRDRYLKRDELGAIFQMCVAPGNQRRFVAATLLQAVFDRAPYGCKLYCCWCAQDIEANKFWEAMGFVPLAFRAGGKVRVKAEGRRMKDEKGGLSSFSPHPSSFATARVHIFWQKRIRDGDETTPYWFPSQTTGGAIGAGRIVLPIPPGTHWSDAKPLILPGAVESGESRVERTERKRLPSARTTKPETRTTKPTSISLSGGLRIGVANPLAMPVEPAKKPKAAKLKAPKAKNDPKLIAAARELRDRWLEQVNANPAALEAVGKYDLRRAIAGTTPARALEATQGHLLEAA